MAWRTRGEWVWTERADGVKVRVVGAHPRHPSLLYNLGCNGVGFLPSIVGGERIAGILAGERLGPSIFDPRRPVTRRAPRRSSIL